MILSVSRSPHSIAEGSSAASGWIVTGILLSAPWAGGSRPYWAALSLTVLTFLATIGWFYGWYLRRRPPSVPVLCLTTIILLALQIGFSLLNPQSVFDVPRIAFLPLSAYVPFLPTTVDVRTGWTFSVEMLAYLCVVVVAASLSRSARWRQRFLCAMAFSGAAVSVAGLGLKAGCWPRLDAYLQDRPWAQGQIFGPFDYHGNAGAFLNLALPCIAYCAAVSPHPRRRVAWRIALAVAYLALFVNGSRAAAMIGMLLSPLCVWIAWPAQAEVPSGAAPPHPAVWKPGLIAFLVVAMAAGLFATAGGARFVRRLRHLAVEMRDPAYPRYLQSRAAWEMAQERPWFGAGVGSYKVLVQTSSIRGYFFAPYFRPGDPFTVLGHTHEDYLQTLAEWGWIGFTGWVVLVSGAFGRLWKLLRRTRFKSRTALALGVALAGVYLHALGDCPLQIPAIQFYMALCLGMAWGSGGWQGNAADLAANPAGNISRQAIVLADDPLRR